MIYGVVIASLLALFAFGLSRIEPFAHLSFTPLTIGIILGLIYGNTVKQRLPKEHTQGFIFCSKTLLRIGIVLYGFRISFSDVEYLGFEGVVIATTMVFGVFFISYIFGTKALKIDKELSALTCAGSSVCGAAAVLGAEATLNSPPYKTSIAIATVVIFGTIFMFALPLAYGYGVFDGFSQKEVGVFVGAVTHEVAHVIGAANAISQEAQVYAVIEKMIRVVMLVPLLFLLPILLGKNGAKKASVPAFALYFLGAIALNSIVSIDSTLLSYINLLDTALLTVAMTALGIETDIRKIKSAGIRPFILALFSAFLLLALGYVTVAWLY